MRHDVIPWEKSEHHGKYISYWGRYGHQKNEYHRTVEYLDDNPRQYWRKGDIIRFDDGKKHPWKKDWKNWFMKKKDYINSLPWHGLTPRYAANQYAIIAGRYRVVKDKYGYFFSDYGAVIMMLTGEKKGHMRKYWQSKPFERILIYPNFDPRIYSIKKLKVVLDAYKLYHKDSNESRNKFLEHLHHTLTKE